MTASLVCLLALGAQAGTAADAWQTRVPVTYVLDYGREHLGVGARTLREWARVWRRLCELPRLRAAVLAGEVSWTVARRVVGFTTPETDADCVETVRFRTVRAVDEILAVVRANSAQEMQAAPAEQDEDRSDDETTVRIPCTRREAELWRVAVELARRVAGETLPMWACADAMAGEAAGLWGVPPSASTPAATRTGSPGTSRRGEPGLRHLAWPGVPWRSPGGRVPVQVAGLTTGIEVCSASEVDCRLRQAIAFLQTNDLEIGRVLRQVLDRRLHREIGFESFSRFVIERLDLAPRTARRLVALTRTEARAPAVVTAFREGRIHAFQAATLARVAQGANDRAWVAWARRVSLRRLESDADEAEGRKRVAIAFRAPREVAGLFLAMLARAGSLEALLVHAIDTWTEVGRQFHDYADFERDGWRCTVPGCTARRNLQSHHLRFRSAGGMDVPWNRTTLCAFHHHRGVHAARLRIWGRAPEALFFELGGERWRSGDLREEVRQSGSVTWRTFTPASRSRSSDTSPSG